MLREKNEGYKKQGNYLLVKNISDKEEITIDCKENTLEIYNAKDSKNKYTISG